MGAREGEQPARGRRGERVAVDPLRELVRGAGAGGERAADAVERLGDERAVGLHVAVDVGERAAVAGQREPGVERVDPVERGQELADGIGRVALVEELRDAPEQVVARDQQAPLGLVQADVRGRVAGRLDHLPVAEVARDRHARHEVAVADELAGDALADRAPLLGPAPQRLLRDARLAGDLDPPRDRLLRRLVVGVQVPVRRVQPDLGPGALADRRRLAAVVDVRVRADDELDVLEPQAGLLERALQVRHRAGLVHPGVDEHDAVAPGERPGVAVRHPGPGEREPQPPDAGEHALPAPDLARACGLAHRAGR